MSPLCLCRSNIQAQISWNKTYPDLWDIKRPKSTLSSSMFGFFCSAPPCCIFHKNGGYLCSASSLQLKYLSAQFGCLKKLNQDFDVCSSVSPLKYLDMERAFQSRASKVWKLHSTTTWSTASALLCLTAPKQSLQDAMFCCCISTAQISKYARYLQYFAAPKVTATSKCPSALLSQNTQRLLHVQVVASAAQIHNSPALTRLDYAVSNRSKCRLYCACSIATPQLQKYFSPPRRASFLFCNLNALKVRDEARMFSFCSSVFKQQRPRSMFCLLPQPLKISKLKIFYLSSAASNI